MNELVKINENNQVTTDSLTVADCFGKRHCDVLRSIKLLKCSQEFGLRNFASAKYLNEQGKEQPYYEMTRDGWMFLVMGFTGEKAAEWKEKFIAAFNALEAALKQNATVPSLTQDRAALKAIGGIVKKCCAVAVREELAKMFDAAPAGDDKTGYGLNELNFGQWRLNTVMAVDAMKALYTRLYAENEMLKQKLLTIKQTVN